MDTNQGLSIVVDDHPLLDAAAFLATWPQPLGQLDGSAVRRFFAQKADAPLSTDADIKAPVRDLLRWSPPQQRGFKPTGRSKPASEYLLKALDKGWLSPEKGINPAVDACNVVSLHSGLPISVVDADLATPPWRLGLCEPGTTYVFNPSGQVIDVGGLISLWDQEGPCAGPVKDSQRTKTHEGTTRTLSVIWGTRELPGRTAAALQWYRALHEELGATVQMLRG